MFFTDRQLKLLAFIRARLDAQEPAPTLQEIATEFGITKVTAHQHLRALEKKGTIRRQRHQARSIELNWAPQPPRPRAAKLPLAGRLFAGGHLDYMARPDNFDPADLVPTEQHGHIVTIVGDHLAADGFPDGALLIIEPRSSARPREIVLAMLSDGTAVIRRYERGTIDDALIPLRPGSAGAAESIAARRVKLLGVVKACVVRFAAS